MGENNHDIVILVYLHATREDKKTINENNLIIEFIEEVADLDFGHSTLISLDLTKVSNTRP